MPAKEKILLRSAQEKDKFGDPKGPVPAWREVTARAVVPRTSVDTDQRGPIVISGFMVSLSPGTPILDNDEVQIRGKVHQIEGVVADYGKKGKLFYTKRVN